MNVLLIKVSAEVLNESRRTNGSMLLSLLKDGCVHPSFEKERDVMDDFDYRDLLFAVEEDETHPIIGMFSSGVSFVNGLEWTCGAPVYHDIASLKALLHKLDIDRDIWPVSEVYSFIEGAVLEQKGVVAGVD